jgi:hypothetical protein
MRPRLFFPIIRELLKKKALGSSFGYYRVNPSKVITECAELLDLPTLVVLFCQNESISRWRP